MFGMENDPETENTLEGLELDATKPNKRKEIAERLEGKIQALKNILRHGDDKDNFDDFGSLLWGYKAAQKTLEKASKRK